MGLCGQGIAERWYFRVSAAVGVELKQGSLEGPLGHLLMCG